MIKNKCIKCGANLIEHEGATFVCNDTDCKGIIISKETLQEWENNRENNKQIREYPLAPDECYISKNILEEIKKCKESPWYFATKYIIVKNHNNQSIPFRTPLTEEEFNNFINILDVE